MWAQRLFTLGGCVCGGGFLATVAVLVTGVAGAVRLPIVVAAGAVGVAVGGVVTNGTDESTIRQFQGELRPVLSLFSPAFLVTVATLAVHATTPGVDLFWPAMAGCFLALGGTLAMAHAAEKRHITQLEAETPVSVRLPGRYTYIRRRYGPWIVVVGLSIALVCGYSLWIVPRSLAWSSLVLAPLVIPYKFILNPDQVVVRTGLVHGVSVEPWDRFGGFAVTQDHLVLHHAGPTRQRRRFPLDEIEDARTATYALSQYLGPAEKEHA